MSLWRKGNEQTPFEGRDGFNTSSNENGPGARLSSKSRGVKQYLAGSTKETGIFDRTSCGVFSL